MRHYVVGTAGHIDHGKSALVKALTGIDPDRLAEEKRRGMTIDLGFAHLDLPSGRRAGIVDVPGHERLIKNMLAGATGIDLVLLVVAADEGVMPQTREHLDILRFLPVSQGIIVLNKIDLVDDVDWLALVRDDVRALAAGTFLEGAPIVEASAKTGQGLTDLVQAVDRMLDTVPVRRVDAPARLPVDRSFVMAGFGTVVTGTLWSGRITTGDVLEVLPRRREVRVRGVQSHGQAVSSGVAGSRVAVNLSGVDQDEIARGDVLCAPGVYDPTDLMDARVRLLASTPPLPHLARIRLYLGSDEAIGRVALLDRSRLEPGEGAPAQIRLEKPIVAALGDPFVIRRYSPMLTLGGGEVLNPHPPKRRRDAHSAAAVEAQATAGLSERMEAALEAAGRSGTTGEELIKALAASRVQVDDTTAQLGRTGRLLQIRGRLFHSKVAEEVAAAIQRELNAYHAAVPWRLGMPREELKGKAFGTGDNRFYAQVLDQLVASSIISVAGEFVCQQGFVPAVKPQETQLKEQIAGHIRRGRFAPPTREEIGPGGPDGTLTDRVLQMLTDEGTLVEVVPGIIFHRDSLEEIKGIVASEIGAKGSITVAALRDRLGTSRKFALTVLEYFDTIKLTRRVGDARVLVSVS